MKFRKKPVVIDAMQFVDSKEGIAEILRFCNATGLQQIDTGWALHIHTLEGTMTAVEGDWIICGVQGEFYPVKPDIFEATYERVEDAS